MLQSSEDIRAEIQTLVAGGTPEQLTQKLGELQKAVSREARIASHPDVTISMTPDDVVSGAEYMFTPYTPDVNDMYLDQYCLDVRDAVKAAQTSGNVVQAFFMLVDLFRTVWSKNPHLPPLEEALQ